MSSAVDEITTVAWSGGKLWSVRFTQTDVGPRDEAFPYRAKATCGNQRHISAWSMDGELQEALSISRQDALRWYVREYHRRADEVHAVQRQIFFLTDKDIERFEPDKSGEPREVLAREIEDLIFELSRATDEEIATLPAATEWLKFEPFVKADPCYEAVSRFYSAWSPSRDRQVTVDDRALLGSLGIHALTSLYGGRNQPTTSHRVSNEEMSMPSEQPPPDKSAFSYDVALSFAGEDRKHAQALAEALVKHGVRVFYDEYEKANLWGKDLYEHLDEVYSKKARYCVLFASTNYARKVWTDHERRSAQERALSEKGSDYILPIKIDETEIPGLRATIGYVSISLGVPHITELLLEKLGRADTEPLIQQATPGQASLGGQQPPFMVVDPPLFEHIAPGVVPAVVELLAADSVGSPSRQVVVVPASIPKQLLAYGQIARVARESQVQTVRGSPMFPLVDLQGAHQRRPQGISAGVDSSETYRVRFGLGFDASFGQAEFIRECVQPLSTAGPGVGLFTCMDRVVGALAMARRLAQVCEYGGRCWLVLKLDGIQDQRLTFDYEGETIRGVHLGSQQYKASVPSIRVGGNFDPHLDDDGLLAFASGIGGALGYYFGCDSADELAKSELPTILKNVRAP